MKKVTSTGEGAIIKEEFEKIMRSLEEFRVDLLDTHMNSEDIVEFYEELLLSL